MMREYYNLLLKTETIIFNHSLVDTHHFNEVKDYKFMISELRTLFKEVEHSTPIVPEDLWELCPLFYGRLKPVSHSNIDSVFTASMKAKARIFTFNKVSAHLGWISMHTKPLERTIDEIITDMQIVRRSINGNLQ